MTRAKPWRGHSARQFSRSVLFWRLLAQYVRGNHSFPTSLCLLKLSLVSHPLSASPSLQPHRARRRFCWWMLKAASVPQQLTPLLQDAACQVDGISPLLLPVTQSRRGTQTNASSVCLLYCFAYSQDLVKLWATREGSGKKGSSVAFVLKAARQSDLNKKCSVVVIRVSCRKVRVPEFHSVHLLIVFSLLKTKHQMSHKQHSHCDLFLKCKPNQNILNWSYTINKSSCVITNYFTTIYTKHLMHSVHSGNTP